MMYLTIVVRRAAYYVSVTVSHTHTHTHAFNGRGADVSSIPADTALRIPIAIRARPPGALDRSAYTFCE
jgi:hypothetical protein